MNRFFLLAGVIFLLLSCSSGDLPLSVVAKVNDRYISLDELKAMHEVQTLSWELPTSPTFEETQLEYADILKEMIMTVLMEEELQKNNIVISDEDVQKELNLLQKDYLPEEFEKMLTENYIELDAWKAQIRARLILDSFLNDILKPQIIPTSSEIEIFYENNKKFFRKPPSVRLYAITASNRKEILDVQTVIKKNTSIAEIRTLYPQVLINELFTVEENLSKKIPSSLKKGDFTRIEKEGTDFVCFYILDRFPAGIPPLKAIYSLVERRFIEERLDTLYEEKITFILEKSTIEIAPSLQPYISIPEVLKKSS